MRIQLALLTLLASSVAIRAQRTWIVDPSGRGDHTTITAAVAAASNGDTLRIVPATYRESPTISKSLTLLGDKGVLVDAIVIANLPTGGSAALSRIELSIYNKRGIGVRRCRGHVAIADCISKSMPFITGTSTPGLTIENCSHVTVHGGEFQGHPGVLVRSSTVALTQVTAVGGNGTRVFIGNINAGPGVDCQASHVVLAESNIRGGSGGFSFPLPPNPAPGIRSRPFQPASDTLLIAGMTTVVAGGAIIPSAFPARAIEAHNGMSLFLDPRAVLRSTRPQDPPITGTNPRRLTLPALRATVTRNTGSYLVDTTLVAKAGWASGLIIGLPGPRKQQDPFGDLWFHPTAPTVLLDVGATDGSGRRTVRVPLPTTLRPGTRVNFQAMTLHSDLTTFQLSTPATVLLR